MLLRPVKVLDSETTIAGRGGGCHPLFYAYNVRIVYPKHMSEHRLFQDTKTGKLVEFISVHDKEFAMVRDASGAVTFLNCDHLVPYDKDKGRLAKVELKKLVPEKEEPIPNNVVPIENTRLNLNTAPAEQIAKRLPGVGFATAKKIVELRMSLSGERFANLKQLENIPRVNWDQLVEEDLIFIS